MRITARQLKGLIRESLGDPQLRLPGIEPSASLAQAADRVRDAITELDTVIGEHVARGASIERTLMRDYRSSRSDLLADIGMIVDSVDDDVP